MKPANKNHAVLAFAMLCGFVQNADGGEVAACCHDAICENITQAACSSFSPSEWQQGEQCGVSGQSCPLTDCINATGSCFVPHVTGGCSDSTCCTTVCGIDSFCCDVEWDAQCVSHAQINCAPPLSVTSSDPPHCAIDARQPHAPESQIPGAGWNSIRFGFSGDPSALSPADFSVTVVPAGGAVPSVMSVTLAGGNSVVLTLTMPIPAGKWTRIRHLESNTGASLGFLPCDHNGNRFVQASDLSFLLSRLGFGSPTPLYSFDSNRSGQLDTADYRRSVEVYNGCGPYDGWAGRVLSACPAP